MSDKPKPEIPNDPAACADLLYKTREKRLKVQKQVDTLQELESELKKFFINNLPKGTTGITGKVARVQTENKIIPTVNDWDKFYAYVKKNNAFFLLQRRLTESSVKDMWDNKNEIPGVDRFVTVSVSCTKR